MSDAGEIAVTSNTPQYYDISGWPEFFPQPEARVPDEKLSGIIALQNALYRRRISHPKAINKEIEEELNAAATREKVAKWEKDLELPLLPSANSSKRRNFPSRFDQWLQKLPPKPPTQPDWADSRQRRAKIPRGGNLRPAGRRLLSLGRPQPEE